MVNKVEAVAEKKSMLDVLNDAPKVGVRLPITDRENANQEFVVPVAVNGVYMQIVQGAAGMTLQEIKVRALFQTGNDADDLVDFLPFLDQYVNDGYDRLLHAWEKKHVGDDEFPVLGGEDDAPLLPDWTHDAIADWATWCLYRNGNPQKQQRGMAFRQSVEEMVARLYAEGGAKGKRDRFINIYP